jgi:hypothetical protein
MGRASCQTIGVLNKVRIRYTFLARNPPFHACMKAVPPTLIPNAEYSLATFIRASLESPLARTATRWLLLRCYPNQFPFVITYTHQSPPLLSNSDTNHVDKQL